MEEFEYSLFMCEMTHEVLNEISDLASYVQCKTYSSISRENLWCYFSAEHTEESHAEAIPEGCTQFICGVVLSAYAI
jgi:hypothetical protein